MINVFFFKRKSFYFLGGEAAETFRNRKGYFSKNVQVVAGPSMEILDIVTRWAGSTHDQTIFNGSNLENRFEDDEFGNFHLLGDSGYECRRYLMTPLRHVNSVAENLYNASLIKTRNLVERTFGVWKRRFPILSLGIRVSKEKLVKADYYVVACAVLHNIAVINREEEPPIVNNVLPPDEDNHNAVVDINENNPRYQERQRLINGWFTTLQNIDV